MFSQVWSRRDQSSFGYGVPNHVETVLITPPAVEPVTLTQAKQHARIPYPDSDELISLYISAARDRIERYLRRSLITQTWDFICDWGPAWLTLPKPPLQTVVGVYTTDLANNETTVPTTTYFVDPATDLVALNIGNVWPLHRGKSGFRVRHTSGFGDTPSSVPVAIRKEILSLVAQFDDIRETTDLPLITQASLKPYRIEGQPFRMAKGWSREDILG